MSKSIMIASGKGGTGKSTFTVNLGITLAYRGYNVVLVDLNLGLRTLDLYLGLENYALFDIGDILEERSSLDDVLIESHFCNRLKLLPGVQQSFYDKLTKDKFSSIIEDLKLKFDYVIIDCPPGIGPTIEVAMGASDAAIIVINANYISLRDADVVEDILSKSGIFNRACIMNRLSCDLTDIEAEVDIQTVSERLRSKIIGTIPDDCNIKVATNLGVPIVVKRDTYIANNYQKISDRIMEL